MQDGYLSISVINASNNRSDKKTLIKPTLQAKLIVHINFLCLVRYAHVQKIS